MEKLMLAVTVMLFWPAVNARADDVLPRTADGVALPGVVFVVDEIFGARHEADDGRRAGTSHWRDGYLYHRATSQNVKERTTAPSRPGRNLFTLIPATPDGTLRRITHLVDGEVFDPEPSYDGRKILFSMHATARTGSISTRSTSTARACCSSPTGR